MKKRIAVIVAVVLACLSGCNTQNVENAVNTVSAEATGFSYNPADYVKLGDYKNLEVTRMSTEVTEEDIANELTSKIESLAAPVPVTDRDNVAEGDIANIDYMGLLDGVAFEGGTDTGFDLTIGSHTFIDGFEEGLVGTTVGETVSLNLVFPENYQSEDLAGQEVVFVVSVNSISSKPEATDDVVKEITNGDYSTVAEYKEVIKDEIGKSKLEEADGQMYTELFTKAVDNAEVIADFPKDLLDSKISLMKSNAEEYAKMCGVDLETYLGYMGKTMDDFNTEIDEYSVTAAKQSMVLNAIAVAEGLSVSDEELDKAIDEYVEIYGYGSKEEFTSSVDLNDFREYILKTKVEEFLADNAVIKLEE